MRRSDREMPSDWALEVMKQAPFMTVAFVKPSGEPYSLPLSLAVSDERTLYFHCALDGEKLDCIAHNPHVSVSAVVKSVPFSPASNPAFFSLSFESAVATGIATVVTDRDEKIRALRLISERFLPDNMAHFDQAIANSIDHTGVVRIDLTEAPTGKRRLLKN